MQLQALELFSQLMYLMLQVLLQHLMVHLQEQRFTLPSEGVMAAETDACGAGQAAMMKRGKVRCIEGYTRVMLTAV
jgi:hypothetical protein